MSDRQDELNRTNITKKEFEDAYAERSGVTVKWLKEHGREAKPCDCGEDTCEGWQMAHVEAIAQVVEEK